MTPAVQLTTVYGIQGDGRHARHTTVLYGCTALVGLDPRVNTLTLCPGV